MSKKNVKSIISNHNNTSANYAPRALLVPSGLDQARRVLARPAAVAQGTPRLCRGIVQAHGGAVTHLTDALYRAPMRVLARPSRPARVHFLEQLFDGLAVGGTARTGRANGGATKVVAVNTWAVPIGCSSTSHLHASG